MESELQMSTEAKLRALAKSQNRSKTSKVRDYLPQIDELKRRGVTNEKILSVLSEDGIEMSLKTFESILHRLRKKRGIVTRPALSPNNDANPQQIKRNSVQDKEETKEISTPRELRELRLKSHDIANESVE